MHLLVLGVLIAERSLSYLPAQLVSFLLWGHGACLPPSSLLSTWSEASSTESEMSQTPSLAQYCPEEVWWFGVVLLF